MDFIDTYIDTFRKNHKGIEKICKTRLPHLCNIHSYNAYVTATGYGNYVQDEDVFTLSLLEEQQKYNVLYKVNKDLVESFTEIPDKQIPFLAFKRLPYSCFAVKTGEIKSKIVIDTEEIEKTIPVDGFIVQCNGEKLTMVYFGEVTLNITFLLKDQKLSFLDAYKHLCAKAYREHKGELSNERSEKIIACMSAGLVAVALQVITYLVCTNADIKVIKSHKVHHKSENTFSVGDNVSKFLRTKYIGGIHHGGTGNPKRPHMRAGHFHHYYVGKGRSQLIVKWIEPMFIHGGDNTIIKV